jgi:hypothetical protein
VPVVGDVGEVGVVGDVGVVGEVGDVGDVGDVGAPGVVVGEVGEAGVDGGTVESGMVPGGHGVVVVLVPEEVDPGVVPGAVMLPGVVMVPGVEAAPGVEALPGVDVVGAVEGGAAVVFGVVTLDPTLVTPEFVVLCGGVAPGVVAPVEPVVPPAGEIGTHRNAPGEAVCGALVALVDDGVCAEGYPAARNTAAAARLPAEISFLMCTSLLHFLGATLSRASDIDSRQRH